MYQIDLTGKNAVVFGVANEHSIAWAIASSLYGAGVNLTIAYANDRLGQRVARLTEHMDGGKLQECDVSSDESIKHTFDAIGKNTDSLDIVVHSIAFANREDLQGSFSEISRENYLSSIDISAYSLIPIVAHSADLMPDGGSVIAMTFDASQRVYPGYNVMGTAKAALENEVKLLASEFGGRNIRVNAISAGPLETLASRGIHGFTDMKHVHAAKSPLNRNITHQEVGNVALFLASDMSSGVTGTIMLVDAGYHIMAI